MHCYGLVLLFFQPPLSPILPGQLLFWTIAKEFCLYDADSISAPGDVVHVKIAALSGPSRINAALILCHFIVWLNKELLADLTRCCVAEDLVLKDGRQQTKIYLVQKT